MKKLLVLLIFSFLSANKIPKYTSTTYATAPDAEPYVYTSKDGKYEYSIVALTEMKLNYQYFIDFRRTSLENDYLTRCLIGFETEKQLDKFIKDFPLSDIEKEFDRIVKIFQENNVYVIVSDTSTAYHAVGSQIEF